MNGIPENYVFEPVNSLAGKQENPFSCKLESRTKLLLAVAAYFLIRIITGIADAFLSYEINFISESGIVTFIVNLIEFSALLIIGKYIYKNVYGAIVFCGIITLSFSFASSLTDIITKPFFIFSPFSPEASQLTDWISTIFSLVLSFSAVLLFTSLEKKEDPEPDAEEKFPKNPALFLTLTMLMCSLVLSIPSAFPMGFLIGASFDSDTTMAIHFINNIMPIISAAVSLFSVLLYYLIIKRKYRLNKKVVCLIAIIFFANQISALIISLLNVGINMLTSVFSLNEFVSLILTSGFSTFSLITSLLAIAITTSKLEPEIRKMK